jgi:hypothetical protein
MKTSTTISKFLIVSCLFFIGSAFSITKVQAKKGRTERELYKGTWIPKVQLKEVTIFANAVNHNKKVLCQMVVVKDGINPFVQLDEITVTPEVNFMSGEIVNIEAGKSIIVENKKVNGKYIPHVNLNQVNIIADKVSPSSSYSGEVQTNNEQGILQVSVRKTFDRLANFLIGQGKIVLRKLMPSWFAD